MYLEAVKASHSSKLCYQTLLVHVCGKRGWVAMIFWRGDVMLWVTDLRVMIYVERSLFFLINTFF